MAPRASRLGHNLPYGLQSRGHTRRFYTPTVANFVTCEWRRIQSLVSDMLDIDDLICQSMQSAKFAIAVEYILNEFRQSLRSAYKIASCFPGLRAKEVYIAQFGL